MGIDLSWNDTKIGKKFVINELEKKKPGISRLPNNTRCSQGFNLNDLILDDIKFQSKAFNRILDYLRQQVITETKGVFTKLCTQHNGILYHFGLGGIHASTQPTHFSSGIILDVDVTSYYPSLAIEKKFYPEHLTELFCEVYQNIREQRLQHAKGTEKNTALKLALNAVFGDSNNKFSPFYDPQFTMSITVNGQLLLAMLAEQLTAIPGVRVLQANTDGLTLHIGNNIGLVQQSLNQWQESTGLQLEQNQYKQLWIRDCNNYIAEYMDGSHKCKGCYKLKRDWHEQQSAMIIPKAAYAYLTQGIPIEHTINRCTDMYDFALLAKIPKNSRLYIGDTRVQNTTRYIITTYGSDMFKFMPALKGKKTQRRFSIQKGYKVKEANEMRSISGKEINRYYYVLEALKLVCMYV